jgi:hypothetical protein
MDSETMLYQLWHIFLLVDIVDTSEQIHCCKKSKQIHLSWTWTWSDPRFMTLGCNFYEISAVAEMWATFIFFISIDVEGSTTDIFCISQVIAKRLIESKQTTPHLSLQRFVRLYSFQAPVHVIFMCHWHDYVCYIIARCCSGSLTRFQEWTERCVIYLIYSKICLAVC